MLGLSSNKVVKKENIICIYLNQPKDFIYDIDDIVIEYNEVKKDVEVVNDSIPAFIKANMKGFFRGDLEEYTRFLEENLEIFFKGEVPKTKEPEKKEEVIRPFELPSDYKFPIGRKGPMNINIEVEKRYVSIVSCECLNLQVGCNRCGRVLRMPGAGECPGCRSVLEIRYIPSVDSEFLGSLSFHGCRFICFNPSRYQLSCDGCHMNYETNELSIGDAFRIKCYECLSNIFLKISSINLIQRKRETLKPGQPLPEKGTCRHYKKSYRWFRFPCCNSLYPCDICHDEESGHVHQMANKMVCGLCSKEQGVGKECSCGMNLKKSTSFWEGGKGTRNKATMSRKDRKKYTK
ncbi:putative zinc finger domain-containing protein [Encephalitozoon intestinalis ATCC 50506]|uniref:Zinc finger domain-containing protein n=1 Tax=Encephalitozoon intestinalis (strain ATCC 50506) TaxID=876142 RepID=E0SA23_ENCIT|nr:putative zinc finger domain-containing protein [Encephalitozoon intestinalis ATCC 50506]ADM12645.1 putative zinc finger domain-containing protein [Encephalitozoon intestinalis ATCC 50506]UTX46505.1 CHY zinc finger domain-containing protein [Encephalitozoon intestinalis]